MKLEILSVNVGMPQLIARVNGEEVWSGIAKQPVGTGRIMVRSTNIEGDGQADLSVHGGADKAVYVYPAAHWPWWNSEKHLICAPNTFGENLTLAGADETGVRIGDRFAWGEVLLEISQPRAPCFKLALHTGRDDVPAAMTFSGHCGWYMRVLREGAASVNDSFMRVEESTSPSVREAFAAVFAPRAEPAALHRIHDAPALSPAWRKMAARKMTSLGQ